MTMTVKNTKSFADERLVPEFVPWHQKQMIEDHMRRYVFAMEFVKGLVVDAACGAGYGTQKLSFKNGVKVIGIDISPEAVNYAKSNYSSKRATFIQANVLNLPFESHSVDSVVSFETLEHVPLYKKFIKEVNRVLKPGGVFVVSTPNILVNGGTANPHHIKELSESEFVDILQKNFSTISLYGQKGMQRDYLAFVVWLTNKMPLGFYRWFFDSLFKMMFRGSNIKRIEQFKYRFIPAFFIAVCEK